MSKKSFFFFPRDSANQTQDPFLIQWGEVAGYKAIEF